MLRVGGISFAVGTGLVVLVILIVTTIGLCLYHWAQAVKEAIVSHGTATTSTLIVSAPPPPLDMIHDHKSFFSIDQVIMCANVIFYIY